ncbi:MAG: thioesterase family protein [Pseudomonadota bacterium]
MNDEFCYLLRVRYSECDMQKVVFNGKYVDYIDTAVTEFMRVIWGNYSDMLSKGVDSQVVKLSINWKDSAYFDDVIAITVKSIQIGSSSFTLQVDFYNHKTAVNIASADITYVMVSAGNHKKMEIAEDMRKKLKEGAHGIIIDHAGVEST